MTDTLPQKFALVHADAKRNCMAFLQSLEPTMQDGKAIRVEFKLAAHDRSLEQNRTQFMWIREIAKQTHETEQEVRRRLKLDHGAPILREREDFEAFWRRVLSHLQRDEQLAAMDYIDVTSVMSVNQMTRYLNEVYWTHVHQGLHLTKPRQRDGYDE